MKKLVIFDLDGTLLNTIADLAQSTNHALNVLGYPTHEESAYNFMVGNGINKLFERALPETAKNEENVLRVRKEFIPYYDAHNADKRYSRTIGTNTVTRITDCCCIQQISGSNTETDSTLFSKNTFRCSIRTAGRGQCKARSHHCGRHSYHCQNR